jgi:hypothetical protein
MPRDLPIEEYLKISRAIARTFGRASCAPKDCFGGTTPWQRRKNIRQIKNVCQMSWAADLFPIWLQPRQNLIRAIGEVILHSGFPS